MCQQHVQQQELPMKKMSLQTVLQQELQMLPLLVLEVKRNREAHLDPFEVLRHCT